MNLFSIILINLLIKWHLSWNNQLQILFFFFFVYRPTRKFFTYLETSPLPVKGSNFYLCSALMAVEQWGFFNVPHPLRHGPTVYNGYLRGPVTLTCVVERLAVELSYLFLRLRSIATGDQIPISSMQGERSTSTPPRRSDFIKKQNVGWWNAYICFN